MYPGTEPDRHSVIVGIDLHMPGGYPWQALRRGSHFRAALYSSADTSGIALNVRSGWPQAGPYVLSAQFGCDNMFLNELNGTTDFQAEIVFTEIHADGSISTRTYKTGVVHHPTVGYPPAHHPVVCS
jgi:hypothetical protein